MVTAVKLFMIKEPKESQPAMASRARRPHAAGCDSFGFLIVMSLTSATASIQMDLAFVAGVSHEDQRTGARPFGSYIGRYNEDDLY